MKKQPSILEVISKFKSEEACIAHFEQIRWPEGLRCVRCKGDRVSKLEAVGKTGKERHLYYCADCDYQYSVTVGTIFHDSHLPLTKWFLAIYMICSAKKSISSKQLQRELNTSYKTAWYMAHRIRLAMQEDEDFCQKFSGVLEVDETYIGGKRSGPRGRAAGSKVPVVGMKERTSGKVRIKAVQNCSASVLKNFIREHAEPGSEIHTDDFLLTCGSIALSSHTGPSIMARPTFDTKMGFWFIPTALRTSGLFLSVASWACFIKSPQNICRCTSTSSLSGSTIVMSMT